MIDLFEPRVVTIAGPTRKHSLDRADEPTLTPAERRAASRAAKRAAYHAMTVEEKNAYNAACQARAKARKTGGNI